MDSSWILTHSAEPRALEDAYREDPRAFAQALAEALIARPEDAVLQCWTLRLEGHTGPRVEWRGLLPAVLLAALSALAVHLPALWLNEEWYYPRFAPLWVFLGLALYFWRETGGRRRLHAVAALGAFAALHVSLLPGTLDSVALALIHLPLLGWTLVGFLFCGSAWRETDARLAFVRYTGELLILGSLLALGGGVFSALTVALFEMLSPQAPEWYATHMGVMGAAMLPMAATVLYDKVFRRHTGIPAVLARIFIPLFLLMVGLYVPAALFSGQSPFVDRNFLIIVNGLLVVVAAMSLLSVAERQPGAWRRWDLLLLALLLLCLLVDVLALSAILFRLASFGLSPNRVVVLGANLIILSHLGVLARALLVLRRGGDGGLEKVRRAATQFLPLYAAWAAFVTFLLPMLFRFA